MGYEQSGMFQAMGLKQSDFTKEDIDIFYEIYSDNYKVYDKDTTLLLIFGKKQEDDNQFGLYGVKVYFDDGISLADFAQNIKTAVADNQLSYTRYDGSPITYRNNKMIKISKI
jgi:hypothetical protein